MRVLSENQKRLTEILLVAFCFLPSSNLALAGIYRYPNEGIHLECDDGKPNHWVIINPGRYYKDRGDGAAIFKFPLSAKEYYSDDAYYYWSHYPYKEKASKLVPYKYSSSKLWHDNWIQEPSKKGIIKYQCKYRKMNQVESDTLLKDAIKRCSTTSSPFYSKENCRGWKGLSPEDIKND